MSRRTLDDHDALKGVEIVRSGVRLHGPVAPASQVRREFRCRDGGADVPGQGTQKQPHALWIPADAIHRPNVHTGHLVYLATIRPQCARERPVHAFGPSPPADEFGHFSELQPADLRNE